MERRYAIVKIKINHARTALSKINLVEIASSKIYLAVAASDKPKDHWDT